MNNKSPKEYERKKAIQLLNEIITTSEDLSPTTLEKEEFKISGELYSEIFNFLTNNNLNFPEI